MRLTAMIAKAWNVLYYAQRSHRLATAGPYARVRHPQYAGFIVIMFGFLLQWPTLLTLIMFPALVVTYVLLARSEERAALAEFGNDYRNYMSRVPAFIPRIANRRRESGEDRSTQRERS